MKTMKIILNIISLILAMPLQINMEIIKKNEEKEAEEKLAIKIEAENKYSFFTDPKFEFSQKTGYVYFSGDFFVKIKIKDLSYEIKEISKEDIECNDFFEKQSKTGCRFYIKMQNFLQQSFFTKQNALRCGKELADFIKEYDKKIINYDTKN